MRPGTPSNLVLSINKTQTFLGFDFGSKRIGIAIGTRNPLHSAPLEMLLAQNNKPNWQSIERLIQEWRPEALVVGIPLTLDGKEQEMSKAARRFSRQLQGRFKLPVHETDERFSSVEAEDIHQQQRAAGKRATADRDTDKLAASIILANWLSDESKL